MDVDGFDASFAFDVTAPVEFALAAFFDRRFVSVVTSAAAHQIAAVHSGGCPVARPSISSEGSDGFIVETIIGRFVQINQIVGCR